MIELTIEAFQPYVGRTFEIETLSGDRLSLALSEVVALPTDGDPRRTRAPFSLIFRGTDATRLRQMVCRLTAQDDPAASTDLFLVPVQPDRDGPRVQAIVA